MWHLNFRNPENIFTVLERYPRYFLNQFVYTIDF